METDTQGISDTPKKPPEKDGPAEEEPKPAASFPEENCGPNARFFHDEKSD